MKAFTSHTKPGGYSRIECGESGQVDACFEAEDFSPPHGQGQESSAISFKRNSAPLAKPGQTQNQFHCSAVHCREKFPRKQSLLLHETTFHHQIKCGVCSHVVTGSIQIPAHLRQTHSYTVPFVCICDECEMFFESPGRYSLHRTECHRSVPASLSESPSVTEKGFWTCCDSEASDVSMLAQLLNDLIHTTANAVRFDSCHEHPFLLV